MRFQFDISEVLYRPITIISGNDIPTNQRRFDKLCTIVNEMGYASAAAQNLHSPITTLAKLKTHCDQRLYIMREESRSIKKGETEISSREDLHMFNSNGLSGFKDFRNDSKYSVVGMIKVGVKTLYVTDDLNRNIEITPLCVLDFYIDNELQRQGYGRRLFEYMMQMEVVSPRLLAYDRPSPKYLSFLRKYYDLSDYLPQANNFVVFKDYGLHHLEIDHRGRPKTSASAPAPSNYLPELPLPTVASVAPAASVGNISRLPAGLSTKTYHPPPIARKPEGLVKKYKHMFEKPEIGTNHGLYPSTLNLTRNLSIIPPIFDYAPTRTSVTAGPDLGKESIPEPHDQNVPEQSVQNLEEAHQERKHSETNISPLKKRDSGVSTDMFLMQNIDTVTTTTIEPKRVDWTEMNELDAITTTTNIIPLKPLVHQYEVDRQNRVATVIAETQLSMTRYPPISIPLEPIKHHKRPIHQPAAGVRTFQEPRKRNYNSRYRSLEAFR